MRILHIHHSLTIGGIESFLCALMNEQARFHDVSFCTWVDGDEAVKDSRLSASIQRFSLHNKSINKKYKLLNEFRLLFLIVRGGYDVVHLHGAFDYYLLSILFLHRRTRFVYTIHSAPHVENRRVRHLILSIKRVFFSRRWIVPVILSENFQSEFKGLYSCEAYVIENGLPKLHLNNDYSLPIHSPCGPLTRVFVHVGRICEVKNQVVLVKVFDRLIKEGEDILLFIVGPVSDQTLFSIINSYLSERIVYLGPSNDVPSVLAKADAMCLPSIVEGFPISVIEALNVGCIPICSPVGGVKDIIQDGKTGFLAQSSSEDDYYLAVRRFLQCDDSHLAIIRENMAAASEMFSISRTRLRYDYLYGCNKDVL